MIVSKNMLFIYVLFVSILDNVFSAEPDLSSAPSLDCVDWKGSPVMCYPPFKSAAYGRQVEASNTCGQQNRQKYCIALSTEQMRTRCEYCDNKSPDDRHPAEFLTDQNLNNWWQSETLDANKKIHYKESVNLTVNLGAQFHVTYLYLKFKSPRPRAMVIYRKFNDTSHWEPWQYYSSNCFTYFNMQDSRSHAFTNTNQVICSQEYSSLNEYYDGELVFSTIKGRPGYNQFFEKPDLQRWSTASQIRIELRKMHTFGDEMHAEMETLLTYFFAIRKLTVGGRCLCNGHGNRCEESTGAGQERQLYCVCHPAHYTVGRSCERCATGYEDLPWRPAARDNAYPCKACNCNGNSKECYFDEALFRASGGVSGGHCVNCRNNTRGPHCELCLEGYFPNPNRPNVCIPCRCNPTGSVVTQCDQGGRCLCKPGVIGEKCTQCQVDHHGFSASGCRPCNCNRAGSSNNEAVCNPTTGECSCKRNVIGEKCDSCMGGYFGLSADDPLGCQPCFCFAHTSECTVAAGYVQANITSVFTKDEESWLYGRGTEPATMVPHRDTSVQPPFITWDQTTQPWSDYYVLHAPSKFLGNARLSYNLFLELELSFSPAWSDPKLTDMKPMMNDVQLVSGKQTVSLPLNVEPNPFPIVTEGQRTVIYRFRMNEESGGWRNKITHLDFIGLLSDLTGVRVRLTNANGYLRLHRATLISAQRSTNTSVTIPVDTVEQCQCPPQYAGLSCELCASGHRRETPLGTAFVKCIPCTCNNHSRTCNINSGVCDCEHNTTGPNCEFCADGYYGDAKLGSPEACRKCDCPGNGRCVVVSDGSEAAPVVACTNCPDHRVGIKCERCDEGYFGDPSKGIPCRSCNCSGNVDTNAIGNCNGTTGECLRCIFHSHGWNCEKCLPGYYLDPTTPDLVSCVPCRCHPNATLPDINRRLVCHEITGQCPCRANVIGKRCDRCLPGYFNLFHNEGCQQCDCNTLGSNGSICSEATGQCPCKPGVGGPSCSQCLPDHFGFSLTGCQPCKCDPMGSRGGQCDETGQCPCHPPVTGVKCTECRENRHNLTAGCPECPPCYGLVQRRSNQIRDQIRRLGILFEYGNASRPSGSVPTLLNSTDFHRRVAELNKTAQELLLETQLGKTGNQSSSTNLDFEIEQLSKTLEDIIQTILLAGSQMTKLRQSKNVCEIGDLLKRTFGNGTGPNDYSSVLTKMNQTLETLGRSALDNLRNLVVRANHTDRQLTTIANTTNSLVRELEVDAQSAETGASEVKKKQEEAFKLIADTERMLNASWKELKDLQEEADRILNKSQEIRRDAADTGPRVSDLDARVRELGRLLDIDLGPILTQLQAASKEVETEKAKIAQVKSDLQGLLQTVHGNITLLTSTEKDIDLRYKSQLMAAQRLREEMEKIRQFLARIKDAQRKIDDALVKGRENLKKLDDFDKTVNLTRQQASVSVDQRPEMEKRVENVERRVGNLSTSLKNIRSNVLNESREADQVKVMLKNQTEKLTLLVNEAQTLNTSADASRKQFSELAVEAQNLKTEANQTDADLKAKESTIETLRSADKQQMSETERLRESIGFLLDQTKTLANEYEQMRNESAVGVQKSLQRLKELKSTFDGAVVDTEIVELKKRDSAMKKELVQMNKEIELLRAEKANLLQIDRFMQNKDGTCFKTGGSIETG